MGRQLRQRIVAVMFGLIVAGFVGEALCRCFPTWHDAFVKNIVYSRLPADLYQPVGGFQPGERPGKVRYRHAPNAQAHFRGLEYNNWVYTNSQGFRVSPNVGEIIAEREVLLLGDSFLFGAQVSWESSFVGQLTQRHPKIQFLNAGVDGYNTEDALDLLSELPLKRTPSEVWLFLFWGNDVWENDWRNRPSETLMPLEGEELSWTDTSVLDWIQYSVLASRLYAIWSIQSDERFAERKAQQEMLSDPDILTQALESTERQLLRFTKECPSVCKVVLIPPADAFEDTKQANVTLPLLMRVIPPDLDVLDLYEGLTESGGRELYFQADPHWNPLGHQNVAEQLSAQMLSGE